MKNRKKSLFNHSMASGAAGVACFWASMAMFFGTACSQPEQKNNQVRPNLLLITIDALRSDHLGCYGYPRATSPSIDALADNGFLFLNAFSASSMTASSLPSIITSAPPSGHGIKEFAPEIQEINPSLSFLPEILKKNGYRTAMISGHGGLACIRGIERGFDLFRDENFSAQEIADQAMEWIAAEPTKPFFAWLHLFEPHSPYTPNMDHSLALDASVSRETLLALQEKYPWNGVRMGFHPPDQGIPRDPQELAFYITQYDGEIRQADQSVGNLMGALGARGLLGNLTVIITADHGEGMGDHYFYYDHGTFVYDFLIRVPLVIWSEACSRTGPVRTDALSSLQDLAATILSEAGIPVPSGIRGTDLLPRTGKPNRTTQGWILSEVYDEYEDSWRRCIRTEDMKLIQRRSATDSISYELYDLKDDPSESVNLFAEDRAVPGWKPLGSSGPSWIKLESLFAEFHSSFLKGEERSTRRQELDRNSTGRLRSLGYVN